MRGKIKAPAHISVGVDLGPTWSGLVSNADHVRKTVAPQPWSDPCQTFFEKDQINLTTLEASKDQGPGAHDQNFYVVLAFPNPGVPRLCGTISTCLSTQVSDKNQTASDAKVKSLLTF